MADETITDDRTTKDRATDVAATAATRRATWRARPAARRPPWCRRPAPRRGRWPTRRARRCASRRPRAPPGRPVRSISSQAACGPSQTGTPSRQETCSATPATSVTASAASPGACRSVASTGSSTTCSASPDAAPPSSWRSQRGPASRLVASSAGPRPTPTPPGRLDRKRPHVGHLRRSAGVQPGCGRRSDDRVAVRRPRRRHRRAAPGGRAQRVPRRAGHQGRRADRTGGRLDACPDALRRATGPGVRRERLRRRGTRSA